MNYLDPERRDALIRDFVLGTMPRRARRRFNRLVDEEAIIADGVHALEEKLLPLAWSLTPVQPSDLVWQRIVQQTGMRHRSVESPARRWPALAAALSVALLAVSIAWWQERTRPPEIVIETVTETVPAEPSIGVVEDEAGNALWVARIYDDLRRADVSVQMSPTQQVAKDYELWILRDDGVPVSLGVLPQSGAASLSLADSAVDALQRGSVLAVSLEPAGGSPQATPTGPVLYTATLLAP